MKKILLIILIAIPTMLNAKFFTLKELGIDYKSKNYAINSRFIRSLDIVENDFTGEQDKSICRIYLDREPDRTVMHTSNFSCERVLKIIKKGE